MKDCRLVKQLAVAIALSIGATTSMSAQEVHSDPDSVRIITADLPNFWRAYDTLQPAHTRADSIAAIASTYFAPASPGLKTYIDRRLQKPEAMLFGLALLPKYFAAVRANTLSVLDHEPVIRAGLRRVRAIYPQARFPDIYFVIAGFNSQGVVLDGKLILAAEMVSADSTTPMQELPPFLRAVDLSTKGLPCILVHELIHFQQDYPRDGTLLAQVVTEGVADFVTERAIGCVPTARETYDWGNAHERELWALFQTEMDGKDFSKWLYNGQPKDRPGQLGYWMGYKIAESYYNVSTDKPAAIRALLNIRDFRAWLDKSAYAAKFSHK